MKTTIKKDIQQEIMTLCNNKDFTKLKNLFYDLLDDVRDKHSNVHDEIEKIELSNADVSNENILEIVEHFKSVSENVINNEENKNNFLIYNLTKRIWNLVNEMEELKNEKYIHGYEVNDKEVTIEVI